MLSVENELKNRKLYSDREVGLTHPDLSSFIRLNDHGDIEIFAAPGVGIVISARSKSISLFGDSINLHCKENGLRWNTYKFNYAASKFSEPTLVKIKLKDIHSAQNGAAYFLDTIKIMEEEEKKNSITIMAENSFSTKNTITQQKYVADNDISDLGFENAGLLEAYSSSYSQEHIALMIAYIRKGMSFNQAHQQALEDLNE